MARQLAAGPVQPGRDRAAVDAQVAAGDVGGAVGGEEVDRRRDVGRTADRAERGGAGRGDRERVGRQLGPAHWGEGGTGRHRHDPRAAPGPLHGGPFDQPQHSPLGGAVGAHREAVARLLAAGLLQQGLELGDQVGCEGVVEQCVDRRGDRDGVRGRRPEAHRDAAGPGQRSERGQQQRGAGQVDGHHGFPGRLDRRQPGRVHQRAEDAGLGRGRRQFGHAAVAGDVGGHRGGDVVPLFLQVLPQPGDPAAGRARPAPAGSARPAAGRPPGRRRRTPR